MGLVKKIGQKNYYCDSVILFSDGTIVVCIQKWEQSVL